ncbi:MAG: hypothetical protein LQ352_005518 [Teloschistes flavicans]|nr:MAG: hypothetical protein LQ352_005518 [Teloschistes flavicans]
MRLISLAPLAVAVSQAGGIGFIGAGYDMEDLDAHLHEASQLIRQAPMRDACSSILPIGVGFVNWGADLDRAAQAIGKYKPAAVWFFTPRQNNDLVAWTQVMREVTGNKTKIWVQVGSVQDALEIAKLCCPDVLVIQGSDAGGHGLSRGAGIISLLPECADALEAVEHGHISLVAAGGVAEGRGVAACLALGAEGVVMGTRFLASTEAQIAKGFQSVVLGSKDGGISTVRTKVYDTLRGTVGWPDRIGGRGIINQSFLDAENGIVTEENKKAYAEALQKGDLGWTENGRLTAYAGTGVGLVNEVQSTRTIIDEIRQQVKDMELRTPRESKI